MWGLLSSAALGCDVYVPHPFPLFPEDGGEAPPNVAFVLDGGEAVELVDDQGAALDLAEEALGALQVWRPVAELAPGRAYTVRVGEDEATFTSGDAALDPPAPPEIGAVDERNPLLPGCGTPSRYVDLDLDAEGAVLAVDRDGGGEALGPEDTFQEVEPAVRVTLDSDTAAFRLGTIDVAGQWSGWSDIEPVGGGGCGCAAAGPGPWTAGWILPLVALRVGRRR